MPAHHICEHCGTAYTIAHLNRPSQYCSRSCKASARTGAANSNWRDGIASHPLYAVHSEMVGRCYNVDHPRYGRYGGRGITVCEAWRSDFWAFVTDVGERPKGRTPGGERPLYSLDRVDNDGPYSPDNCRWATAHQQRINQSRMTREEV